MRLQSTKMCNKTVLMIYCHLLSKSWRNCIVMDKRFHCWTRACTTWSIGSISCWYPCCSFCWGVQGEHGFCTTNVIHAWSLIRFLSLAFLKLIQSVCFTPLQPTLNIVLCYKLSSVTTIPLMVSIVCSWSTFICSDHWITTCPWPFRRHGSQWDEELLVTIQENTSHYMNSMTEFWALTSQRTASLCLLM